MVPELRQAYNRAFTEKAYQQFLDWIAGQFHHRPPFKIAETPVFFDEAMKQHLFDACEEITDVLVRPDFRALSGSALKAGQEVPNETPHTTFLQMDFGICRQPDGSLIPQLIEVQGFPSLYFFQDLVARGYREFFDIPDGYTHLFGGLDPNTYIEKLRHLIVGDHDPEQVILLEVEPGKQPTEIDFIACRAALGIEYRCVSELIVRGRQVFYEKNGRRIPVKRIFNRVIFDELIKRDDLPRQFVFTQPYDVEWAGHPNWFFRISKHTLPLLESRYVPESHFLNELDRIPENIQDYVLKPLYSFAGTGVIINLSNYDIESIPDPEHYILQRKVAYAPVVETPDQPAKLEVRMLMLWERPDARPTIVNNLVRLSKGEMVGVRYNQGKSWVGGSVGFFPT